MSPGGRNFNNYRGGRGRARSGGHNNNRPTYQICNKVGHTANVCYYKMDNYFVSSYNGDQQRNNSYYQAPQQAAYSASHSGAPSNVGDQAWYMDSGASVHVTSDSEVLSQKSGYSGYEKLIVGNGDKLAISHIGQFHIPTSNNKTLLLHDTLHVPQIKKNILSVSKLIAHNDIVVEFNSLGCNVKDKRIGEVLLQGSISDGLYKVWSNKKNPVTSGGSSGSSSMVLPFNKHVFSIQCSEFAGSNSSL